MKTIERAIFPAFLTGSLFILFSINFLANPQIILASASLSRLQVSLPLVISNSGSVFGENIANTIIPPEVVKTSNQPPVFQFGTSMAKDQNHEPAPGSLTLVGEGSCMISSGFPQGIQKWCSLIERYAAKNSIENNLLAALILQESGGDPNAYSYSGAVGLMQVMPRDGMAATMVCDSGPCFSDRPSISELKDPEFNIAYGSQMLAELVRKYGTVREALRAYGPMDVGYSYADTVIQISEQYQY
jgi:hypothetical protein